MPRKKSKAPPQRSTLSNGNSLMDAFDQITFGENQEENASSTITDVNLSQRPTNWAGMKMEPPKLCMDDVKGKKDFQLWMRKWSLFTEGSGLHLQSKRMQAVILQCCLDDRMTQSLTAHGMGEEDEKF